MAFLFAVPAHDLGIFALSSTFGSSFGRSLRERVHTFVITARCACSTFATSALMSGNVVNLCVFMMRCVLISPSSVWRITMPTLRNSGMSMFVCLSNSLIFRSMVSRPPTTSFVSTRNANTSSIITTSLALFFRSTLGGADATLTYPSRVAHWRCDPMLVQCTARSG